LNRVSASACVFLREAEVACKVAAEGMASADGCLRSR